MRAAALFALFLLTSCAAPHSVDYRIALQSKNVAEPEPHAFQQCHGYGCKYKSPVEMDGKEWKKIAAFFQPAPKDAPEERQRLKNAIGYFEELVGARTGTDEDIRGTFVELGDYQLDCSDESLNTTIYLVMLDKKGLLKFHSPGAPDGRYPILHSGTWPHRTATIVEKESGRVFAVDSWFHDNGKPAEIVPLEKWKDGWKPDNFQGG